jgi:hypothetical protein
MGSAPKKYWTPHPPRYRLNIETGRELQSNATGSELKIDVAGVGVRARGILQARVARQVLLSLSRFGPQIRKVTVQLAEPTNPLGGIDQRCRMRAWLIGGEDVRAEAINGRIETAVARAAAQLVKRMDRALDDEPAGLQRRRAPRPRRRVRA